MGSSTESVRVLILGEEYSVSGDVNTDTTKKVGEYVGRKMDETQEASASREKLKTAILSAMNIAGELFECRASSEQNITELAELETRAAALVTKIDAVLDARD